MVHITFAHYPKGGEPYPNGILFIAERPGHSPLEIAPADPFAVVVTASPREFSTTSSTVPAGKLGLRLRPFATVPTPEAPASANRESQRHNTSGVTWQRRAISALATPSPAHSKARARITFRRGSVVDPSIRSSPGMMVRGSDDKSGTGFALRRSKWRLGKPKGTQYGATGHRYRTSEVAHHSAVCRTWFNHAIISLTTSSRLVSVNTS